MKITHPSECREHNGTCPTQEKVLHGATELFAKKGFQDTTVQDICEKAGSNIAAVNYHFGSKGRLYLASWAYAARLSEEEGGPIDNSLPPEKWLRQVVQQRIKVMFTEGPGGWFPLLIHHEIHNRSPYFEEVLDTFMGAIRQEFIRKISAYLGPEATPFQTESAVHAIMGFMPMASHMRHHGRKRLTDEELGQLTRQTQAYILGGLKAVKQLIHKEARR